MSPSEPALSVDIVSDVVCPWCIVGYRQLAQASRDTGIAIRVAWHPFELNPSMPPEGQNLREHIMQKYGSSRADSDKARERLTEIGAELGFDFNYGDDMRMLNTFKAHQLIHWAGRTGRDHEVNTALFDAFFTQGRDISDMDTLVGIAEGLGLDGSSARKALEDGTYASEVRRREEHWQRQGIQGVPAMIFEGRHLVTGAQGVETYSAILRQLVDMRAAQPQPTEA